MHGISYWMTSAGMVAASLLSLPAPAGERGSSPVRPSASVPGGEITPQLRQALRRGFRYLLENQRKTGTFAGAEGYPVACDALGGLAFLAGGYTDGEGPYTEAVARAVANLLRVQNERGYFDDGQSRMYGHGFATLFFAELYGMTGDRAHTVRRALKSAIRLIERSQGPDGGWDYQPDGGLASRGSDTSITVCQTMALRAARNLGIEVDEAVVGRARDYIRRAQNDDGGFCYRITSGRSLGQGSGFPRSAAGVCILFSLATRQEYSSPSLRKGFDYLLENYKNFNQFPYYGDYYCTQALFQAGGKYWADYFPYLREKLIRKQTRDGSWAGWGAEVTPQATAMALIALQVPFRLLPIVER